MALYEVIWKDILPPFSTWNKAIWNTKLVTLAHYAFFIQSLNQSRQTTGPQLENLTLLDHILVIITAIGWISRFILAYYIDLTLLFTSLTLWTTMNSFSQKLEKDINYLTKKSRDGVEYACQTTPTVLPVITPATWRKLDWSEVYRNYSYIRELCILINKACGTMVTIYLGNSLLYHSTSLDDVLTIEDISKRIRLVFFIVNSTCTFLVAADANSQVCIHKICEIHIIYILNK